MAHRLALACGESDVESFLGGMDVHQFIMWAEFYDIDPWGGDRADYRVGQLTALMASAIAAFGKRRGGRARQFKPSDFMYSQQAKRRMSGEAKTPEQLMRMVEGMAKQGWIKRG